MANLDDFFAKKDKKKKKGFSKANADVLAKNLHEHELKEAKLAALEEKNAAIASYEATKAAIDSVTENSKEEGAKSDTKNDDEWLNYEEEEKDYTGLKIEALKVDDDDNKEQTETQEKDNDNDGEDNENDENDDDDDDDDDDDEKEEKKTTKKTAGPWKRSQAEKSSAEPTKHDSATASVSTSSSGPSSSSDRPSGSYVPPGRRLAGGASGPTTLQPMRLGKRVKAAPNIDSEMNFPSLSASMIANPEAKNDDGGAFTEVRSTGASQSVSSRGTAAGGGAPQLETGNKFAALRS